MPLNLFGPNIGKMKRNIDVEGLLRVIRRDKTGADELQRKKDAFDALCSMGDPALPAVLAVYEDQQLGCDIGDYVAFAPDDLSPLEMSPEIATARIDALLRIIRRDKTGAEELQRKKGALDVLCSMGDPALPAVLALYEDVRLLADEQLNEFVDYMLSPLGPVYALKAPEVRKADLRRWQRRNLVRELSQSPVDIGVRASLGRQTREQLLAIAYLLGVTADSQMKKAEMVDRILAGRALSPTADADRAAAQTQVIQADYRRRLQDGSFDQSLDAIRHMIEWLGHREDPLAVEPIKDAFFRNGSSLTEAVVDALRDIPGLPAFEALLACMQHHQNTLKHDWTNVDVERFGKAIVTRARKAGAAGDADVLPPLREMLDELEEYPDDDSAAWRQSHAIVTMALAAHQSPASGAGRSTDPSAPTASARQGTTKRSLDEVADEIIATEERLDRIAQGIGKTKSDPGWRECDDRLTQIGRELHAAGGEKRMKAALELAYQKGMRGRYVDRHWSGIGHWMG